MSRSARTLSTPHEIEAIANRTGRAKCRKRRILTQHDHRLGYLDSENPDLIDRCPIEFPFLIKLWPNRTSRKCVTYPLPKDLSIGFWTGSPQESGRGRPRSRRRSSLPIEESKFAMKVANFK